MRKPRQRKPNDLSRSLAALDLDHTLIAVVEMSLSSWLVAGIVPGVERQPLKKGGGPLRWADGIADRSGTISREKGIARSGNARVRRGMVQLAWRFLLFQKDSALAQWYRQRTENAPKLRKTMIVALARKLLVALWRLVREGVVPEGVAMRTA